MGKNFMKNYWYFFLFSLIGCTSTKSIEKQSFAEYATSSIVETTKTISYKPPTIDVYAPMVYRDSVFSGSVISVNGDTVSFSMPLINVDRSRPTQMFANIRVRSPAVKAVETVKVVNSSVCKESKSDLTLNKSSPLMSVKEIIVWCCLFLGLFVVSWFVIKKKI
jgi:hypothetical protein